MNMPRFTAAALDGPTDASTSRRPRSPSLDAVRACTPLRNQSPMVEWRARRDGSVSGKADDASSLDAPADENLVGDTLTAFRTALQQAEDVDSAADLTRDGSKREAPADDESLDYFAPAFRRALDGGKGNNGTEYAGAATSQAGQKTDSFDSLDYFAPAFHQALGLEVEATFESDAENAGNRANPGSDVPSLKYFAPAFRRALDGAEVEGTCELGSNDEVQGGVRRFKEAMKNVPHRVRLEVSDFVPSGLDLDRMADRFFGPQTRDIVVSGP